MIVRAKQRIIELTVRHEKLRDAFTARKAEDQRRQACGLPPRRRRQRRSLQDMLAADANAPPAITA